MRTSVVNAVFQAFLFATIAIFSFGCSSGDSCPPNVIIAFSSPANGADITADQDPDTAGIQVNISARSSLAEGTDLQEHT